MFNKWKSSKTFHPIERLLIKEINNNVSDELKSLIDVQIKNVSEVSRDIISKGKYYIILIFSNEDGQFPGAINIKDFIESKVIIDGNEASIKVTVEEGFLFYFEIILSKGKLKPTSSIDQILDVKVKEIVKIKKVISPICKKIIESKKFRIVSSRLSDKDLEQYKGEFNVPNEYWEFMLYCSAFEYGDISVFSPESLNLQDIKGEQFVLFGEKTEDCFIGSLNGGQEVIEYDDLVDEITFTKMNLIEYLTTVS
jgi:hypothetical protein